MKTANTMIEVLQNIEEEVRFTENTAQKLWEVFHGLPLDDFFQYIEENNLFPSNLDFDKFKEHMRGQVYDQTTMDSSGSMWTGWFDSDVVLFELDKNCHLFSDYALNKITDEAEARLQAAKQSVK